MGVLPQPRGVVKPEEALRVIQLERRFREAAFLPMIKRSLPAERIFTKPGRNDLCPCGSGVKYKKCCRPK
jgi:uncharacterized protein YecA (UPF0149 family)